MKALIKKLPGNVEIDWWFIDSHAPHPLKGDFYFREGKLYEVRGIMFDRDTHNVIVQVKE